MPLIAGNYDIEAYQNSTLNLYVSHVSDDNKVYDYSEVFNGTDERRYGLMMWVRPKKDALPDNSTLLDSINDFDFGTSDFLGEETEDVTLGQIKFVMSTVSDENDLTESTFQLFIASDIMKEVEGGTYYYDIDLVYKNTLAGGWTAANTAVTKLMYGRFVVVPAMIRAL